MTRTERSVLESSVKEAWADVFRSRALLVNDMSPDVQKHHLEVEAALKALIAVYKRLMGYRRLKVKNGI